MKHISWKYVAGLIDGEGCLDFMSINIKKGKNGHLADRKYITGRIRVTLSGDDNGLLDNMKNQFGGHIENREFKNKDWQPARTWTITGKRIIGFLQEVKKFLIIKRNQAEFLLKYMIQFSGKRFDEPDKGQEFRFKCYSELKAMKRQPHRLSEPANFLV